MTHRYEALGYSRNPFGVLSDEEWEAIAIVPAEIARVLEEQPARHLQIIGDKGLGKSTILRGLRRELQARGLRVVYERLPEGAWRFTSVLTDADVFLLDEAQRLAPWERFRLAMSARTTRLILGTHADWSLAFFLHRIPVETIRLAPLARTYFRDALERRLRLSALAAYAPRAILTDEAVTWLERETYGNLRAADAILYEVFTDLDCPRPVTRQDVASVRRRLD